MLHASASPWARCRTSAEVHAADAGQSCGAPGRPARSNRPASVPAPRPARGRGPGSGCVVLHPGGQEAPARHPRPDLRGRRHPHPVRRRVGVARPVPEPARRTPVTSSRQARNASLPVTTCSMQAGASASNTASVRPTRIVRPNGVRPRPAVRVRQRQEAVGSSCSPTSRGSWSSAHSAPSPQARAATRSRWPQDLIRAGPTGVRVARNQMSPEPAVGRVAGAAAMQPEDRRQLIGRSSRSSRVAPVTARHGRD